MTAVNRETVRDALVTLLGGLVTDGTVQEVVGHRVSDPQGKSPVVAVLSNGTLRVPFTFQATRPAFNLLVQTLVFAEDDGSYTEADAEDRLDLVEAGIATLIDANRSTATWASIQQADASEVMDVTIGGHAYLLESTPFTVLVHK